MNFRACAVIPVFNHHTRLNEIVVALLNNSLPCILVDDGSDAATKHELMNIVARHASVECVTLPKNQGKGAAVMLGLAHAGRRGFTHGLQIDADGQHDLADIPAMLNLAQQHPHCLISGAPHYDDSVPTLRFLGRFITHGLIWLDTLSLQLKDSMCGFRVYPIEPSVAVARRVRIGRHMDFDTDIMTRLYWSGTESLFLPTAVHYPQGGTSHFRMLADNAHMAWLHARLFLGMLPRIPKLLHRNVMRSRGQHWTHIAERGNLLGLRIMGLVDRVLGRTASIAVLYPVTAYFFLTHPRARRASRQFLIAAGVRPSLAVRFDHFMQFSISILDKVAAWHDPQRIVVRFSGHETLTRALAAGRGVLLLSAHLGNLELARALSSLMPGLYINALVFTSNSQKVNAMLDKTSAAYRVRLIRLQEIGADTSMMLREKIAAGEVVVIVGDRASVADHGSVVTADFLGRPAPFAIGPYVLAHVLECPVYLFFCLREGRNYAVHMEPFAEHIHLPREGRARAASVWAARYAQRLAYYARRFPLQWYNFYDFWADGVLPPTSGPAITSESQSDAPHSNACY